MTEKEEQLAGLGVKELTKRLMSAMQYDNGCINRYEEVKFPEEFVQSISKAYGKFLLSLTEELGYSKPHIEIENIDGYSELDKALDDYFDSL